MKIDLLLRENFRRWVRVVEGAVVKGHVSLSAGKTEGRTFSLKVSTKQQKVSIRYEDARSHTAHLPCSYKAALPHQNFSI
jgi:hypothetical protein